MPPIARKIVVCAAIDGLIIQPLLSKGQRTQQPVRIKYGDASITNVPRDSVPDFSKPNSSFEAFGVVGLITVSRLSYLITITRRQQVAQIFGYPIYVITEVAITPCSSQSAATEAIAATSLHLRGRHLDRTADDSDTAEDEADAGAVSGIDEVEDSPPPEEAARTRSPGPDGSERSSIAEDVISKKGSYGRFAQRWFSRSGWAQDQKRNMGMTNNRNSNSTSSSSPEQSQNESPKEDPAVENATPPKDASQLVVDDLDVRASTLLPKLLRTAHVLFGTSRSFYFSYDYDLTHSIATQRRVAPMTDEPLHTQVDPVFFWNKYLLRPFSDAGQESLLLPLMQGFVGQRSFVMDGQPPQTDDGMLGSMELQNMSPTPSLPGSPPTERTLAEAELRRPSEKTFLLTIVSRRSTKRAGLRYLRRGIDEDGYVANSVQTEQILSSDGWDPSSKVYSFLQIRGSIPLFFTQSPYSLKPAPVIQHSLEANYVASRKHFERLRKEYGMFQIVNLVEKHGVEARVGEEFQRKVQRLNEETAEAATEGKEEAKEPIGFEWFDFHAACRGMKFENVSLLLQKLRPILESFGSTVATGPDGLVLQNTQRGVLRTNCMDCLDRTNVCQSSFGRYMLEVQLKDEGIDMSAQADQEHSWFNTLWADNGDAISKQYASTAAMKGDYTRTRKRNYRGTLNDLGLSLTRFYNGMVNDYFSQAAIDFFLGNVTAMVFDEFETDMMTKDPAVSMLKMREQAIELCQRRVIADESEEFHGGWVLLSPHVSDTVRTLPFDEVVLLLTDAALYLCRFDWNLDKVSSFDRVDLAHVTAIKFGTYVTSTLAPVHMDELKNVGFVVEYQPGKNDITRTNTRTLTSLAGTQGQGDVSNSGGRTSRDGTQSAGRPSGLAGLLSGGARSQGPVVKRLAFKAPYSQSSIAVTGEGPKMTEIQQVVTICAEIERLAFEAQPYKVGKDGERERESIIEKGEIISLEEAKRSTGLLEQLGHTIKRMVWA